MVVGRASDIAPNVAIRNVDNLTDATRNPACDLQGRWKVAGVAGDQALIGVVGPLRAIAWTAAQLRAIGRAVAKTTAHNGTPQRLHSPQS